VYLQDLHMCRLSKLTDERIQYVATRRAESLQTLAVSLCDEVTTDGMTAACLSFRNLHFLAAANCCKVTGEFLNRLHVQAPVGLSPFRRMVHLSLRHCGGFDAETIRSLASLLAGALLKQLYLGNCFDTSCCADDTELLSVALLDLLACSGRSLEVLDLENATFFRDSAAEQLPSICKNLMKLVVSGTMITPRGLSALASMTQLRELTADYCMLLTEMEEANCTSAWNRLRMSTKRYGARGITATTPVPGAPPML
jgi:hypothetical protein